MSVMGRPPKSPNYTEREQRLKQEAEVAKAQKREQKKVAKEQRKLDQLRLKEERARNRS